MDSLTQVALGGAVAYAVMGNKVGRKAILWGAALGTLPDLDVFLPYAGEVEAFTYHTGFSHSLLVQLLISPIITWFILKLHPTAVEYKRRWFLLVFLCLSTHGILDSLTVYGTQLLWPLTEYPFGVSNLFIIDPFYTIPLLVGLIWASLPLKNRARAYKANAIGIAISSVYVCWTLGAKLVIDTKIEAALASRDITVGAYMSTPAPLNTLLWRAVAVSDTEYYEIYASIFDSPNDVSIDSYPSDTALLTDISDQWSVQRLQWFTKGLYAIKQYDNKVVLSDLRMGVECNYVFNFILADIENGQLSPLKRDDIERFTQRPDLSGLGRIWQRITDPSISLAPARNDSRCSTIPDLP